MSMMLVKRNQNDIDKKAAVSLGIFSFIFGLAFSLARQLAVQDEVRLRAWEVILSGCICFVVLMFVWNLIRRTDGSKTDDAKPFGRKGWIIIFVLSLCVNVLCLLTYFPGVGMNDGLNIMLYGMSQAQQFPVFYCAVLVVLTRIGEMLGTLQYSVILYSVLQIIIVSALYAWIAVWFSKKAAPKCMKYIIVIYFLAEPLLAMYAISMLKDTLFSLFLLIFMMLIYDLVIEKKKIGGVLSWLSFMIVIAGILCLRNNGSYILFPVLLILLLCCSGRRYSILWLLLFSIAVYGLGKAAMMYFGAEQLFQEMVGIPLQQMAAVVAAGGTVTPEQAAFLNNLMPLNEMAARYNPVTVDVIKWNHELFNGEFLESHKKEFLITWMQMLPKNFSIYVKAYLQQTFWFWAPWQEGNVQCLYTIENVADNGWLMDFLQTSGIHDQILLPDKWNAVMRNWYGLANKFFREGVCFWIMMACLVLSILKTKKRRMLLVFAPVFLLWLTIMISTPVAESMRYVFVFAYALPFFIGILFINVRD